MADDIRNCDKTVERRWDRRQRCCSEENNDGFKWFIGHLAQNMDNLQVTLT
jgi:hypothetical protein